MSSPISVFKLMLLLMMLNIALVILQCVTDTEVALLTKYDDILTFLYCSTCVCHFLSTAS